MELFNGLCVKIGDQIAVKMDECLFMQNYCVSRAATQDIGEVAADGAAAVAAASTTAAAGVAAVPFADAATSTVHTTRTSDCEVDMVYCNQITSKQTNEQIAHSFIPVTNPYCVDHIVPNIHGMVDKQCEVATKTEVLHGTTNAAKSAGSLLLFSTVGQVPAAAAPSLPPSLNCG